MNTRRLPARQQDRLLQVTGPSATGRTLTVCRAFARGIVDPYPRGCPLGRRRSLSLSSAKMIGLTDMVRAPYRSRLSARPLFRLWILEEKRGEMMQPQIGRAHV